MKSLWQSTAKFKSFPKLDGDIKTDVAIVGGGIVGMLTAYFLDRAGVPYVLIEKDRLCGATTGHTTGKITVGHGLIYSKILNSEGLGAARAYYTANLTALEAYGELCKNINCDYEVRDNVVYSRSNRKRLEEEMSALERIGAQPYFCENIPIPQQTVGAVGLTAQAQLNPLKLLAELSKELNVYEYTHARDIRGGKVITDRGTLTAENIIVATHFPIIDRRGFYFLKMYQHRSYVLALENAQRAGEMYVDEDECGMSFRDFGKYLLLGGGGHRTGKRGGSYGELRDFAARHYPNAAEKYAWAAQDCMTLDSVPYIGRYSKSTQGLYTATGFNKWGMTGAMLSAVLLSDMIIGKSVEHADIFDPSRSIFKPQLFLNIAETLKNIITPTVPRCSHLGCALKWNPAEHTWDCPCHGSRYSERGEVLDTPANKNKNLK